MNRNILASLCISAGLCFAGLALADDMGGMKMDPVAPSSQPSTQPSTAVDLRNTVCPVSGDKVADSNLVVVYDGKVYHMCCADCHKDFEKDPAKFSKAVAADPAKFGVK
ncbi:MAG: TRASH domain-containing protein [Planctomycetota bacterium]|nr:TRASH domain-containing protein [Planctomycetota bacterium]